MFAALTDIRKERKRNLLPARVGIYGIIMFLLHTIAWQVAFSLKVTLLRSELITHVKLNQ